MNKKICSLLALPLFLAGNVKAADDRLQACTESQGQVSADRELECYRQAALEHRMEERKAPPSSSVATRGRNLADEWAPTDGVPLKLYKQTYFLVTHTYQPNSAPSSPNPQNQVPFAYPLMQNELKFQISIKTDLISKGRHALWVGYTQQSFWQVFDTRHSNPFRESNYEPEAIYSYRPENKQLSGTGLSISFLNIGFYQHQSNGQSLPRSRSWTRSYVQAGLERDLGDYGRLALLPRVWKRWGGGGIDDDNPDILRHLGHGDLEMRYYYGHGMLSAIARSRSLQLDLSLRACTWDLSLLCVLGVQNADLHLQYFHGYGESLIDYNQGHTTLGLGISMPFE